MFAQNSPLAGVPFTRVLFCKSRSAVWPQPLSAALGRAVCPQTPASRWVWPSRPPVPVTSTPLFSPACQTPLLSNTF